MPYHFYFHGAHVGGDTWQKEEKEREEIVNREGFN